MLTEKFFVFEKLFFFLNETSRKKLYKILNTVKEKRFFIKGGDKLDLIIIDNFLPSPLSPWRTYEFSELCKKNSNSRIYCDLNSFKKYSIGNSFNDSVKNLEVQFPSLKDKIYKFSVFNFIDSRLVYFLFYENVNKYFEILVRLKQDFVFTLYPGGCFEINNSKIDSRLSRICQSDICKKVIVNQYLVEEYLIDNRICPKRKIKLIHGVPLNLESSSGSLENQKKDLNSTLKVLFMGNKYTKDGEDKGFPVFVDFAHYAVKQNLDLKFVIAGNFSRNDVREDLQGIFEFRGFIQETDFTEFFKDIHIIISPNQPFRLKLGAFDGFPLATCVSAAFNEVLILATDFFEEGERIQFQDKIHFLKIFPTVKSIVDSVNLILSDRSIISSITRNAKLKIKDHYSFNSQIKPRLNLFEELLK